MDLLYHLFTVCRWLKLMVNSTGGAKPLARIRKFSKTNSKGDTIRDLRVIKLEVLRLS